MTSDVLMKEPFIGIFTTDKVFDGITQAKANIVCADLENNADGDAVYKSIKDKTALNAKIQVMDLREARKVGDEVMLAGSVFIYDFVIVIALIGILNIINTVSSNI